MTDELTDELDLDAIEIGARAWAEQLANDARRGPIGTMYVSPWEVRALVAALRSERTQYAELVRLLEIEEGTSWMLATDRDDSLNEAEELRKKFVNAASWWHTTHEATEGRWDDCVNWICKDAREALGEGQRPVVIPHDPDERARLMDGAGLSRAERDAIDQWCYDEQRKRVQGVVPEDEAGRR